MRRLIIAALAVVTGCASAGAPPGGPEDHEPPQIVSITPDSGATNVNARSVEFRFDEVVSDRPAGAGAALDQIFLISPRNGAAQVSWHRNRITVKPRNGLRPNTAYRVTLLPGLADLRTNVRRDTKTIVFATGPTMPPFSIVGRVFDWVGQRPANGAYIEAISHPDTSIVYLSASDSLGQFDVGPLPAGTYTLRGLIDQNANRIVDRAEKWDSVTVVVASTSPGGVELDAIERDSTPAFPDNITMIDSVHLRITFDKPLDPRLPLQPALIRLQRADSAELQVTAVQWQTPFDEARTRATADSARRADTTRARQPAVPPSGVAVPGGPRTGPPPPKPQSPAPDRGIVLTVSPSTPLRPNSTYAITIQGFRNLLGNSSVVRRTFTTPKPAAPKDSTARPPGTPPPVRPPASIFPRR